MFPLSRTSIVFTDAAGRVVQSANPTAHRTRIEYDALDRVKKKVRALRSAPWGATARQNRRSSRSRDARSTERRTGVNDVDTPMPLDVQQMRVARDDQIDLTGDGGCENDVVGRVTQDNRRLPCGHHHFDERGIAFEKRTGAHTASKQRPVELGASEHTLKLHQQRDAGDKLYPSSARGVYQSTGHAAPDQGRDNRVGVSDQPHCVALRATRRSRPGSRRGSSAAADLRRARLD